MRERLLGLLLLTLTITNYQGPAFAGESPSEGFYATITLIENGCIEANLVSEDEDGAIIDVSGIVRSGSQMHQEFLREFTDLQQGVPHVLDLQEARWLSEMIQSEPMRIYRDCSLSPE